MTSPRLNGQSEKMGFVRPLDRAEVEVSGTTSEHEIRTLLDQMDLGSVALLNDEFKLSTVEKHPSSGTRASFLDRDELARGRDEGQHGARFGQMIINGAGVHERPALVAGKPFSPDTSHNTDEGLAREWAIYDRLNAIGDEQLAYLPLGVWKNVEGISHLITVYEHDVISHDNTFWADRDANPEALRKENIEEAFRSSMLGLGYLHGAGISHGDAEAKNLAQGRKGFRFIDLEYSTDLPTGKKPDATLEAVKLTRADIETFFDSTVQVDENRDAVADVLVHKKMQKELAKLYRTGLRAAARDLGVKGRMLPTSSDRYFEDTFAHTLKVAQNR